MLIAPPRRLQPERMDDPSLDEREHRRALRGLARINAVSGTAKILWPRLAELISTAHETPPQAPGQTPHETPAEAREITVLDVACGAGDVLARLARLAQTQAPDRAIRFSACDVSPVALDETRRRIPGIETFQRNVIADGLPAQEGHEYDVVLCSLFIHHLTEDQIVRLLAAMSRAARRAVLITDLNRTRRGLALAAAVPRLLTRSRIVHTDAVLSARAALTTSEIADLAEQAGLHGATITRHTPSRWLLEWLTRWGPERRCRELNTHPTGKATDAAADSVLNSSRLAHATRATQRREPSRS